MRKAAVTLVAAAVIAAVPTSSAVASGRSTTLQLVGTTTSQVNQPHGFSFTEVLSNTQGKKGATGFFTAIVKGNRVTITLTYHT